MDYKTLLLQIPRREQFSWDVVLNSTTPEIPQGWVETSEGKMGGNQNWGTLTPEESGWKPVPPSHANDSSWDPHAVRVIEFVKESQQSEDGNPEHSAEIIGKPSDAIVSETTTAASPKNDITAPSSEQIPISTRSDLQWAEKSICSYVEPRSAPVAPTVSTVPTASDPSDEFLPKFISHSQLTSAPVLYSRLATLTSDVVSQSNIGIHDTAAKQPTTAPTMQSKSNHENPYIPYLQAIFDLTMTFQRPCHTMTNIQLKTAGIVTPKDLGCLTMRQVIQRLVTSGFIRPGTDVVDEDDVSFAMTIKGFCHLLETQGKRKHRA